MIPELSEELKELERAGLLRREAEPLSGLDACSNDYLGYARRQVSRETVEGLLDATLGAGASRLIHGTAAAHLTLEQELAEWTGLPTALLFSSGFAANCGAIPAVAGPQDVILSDRLNHASIIDGCRLSRARVQIVPHRDLDALETALGSAPSARRRWVVTESYFSMDGTSPDLAALRSLCDRYGASLFVDEAHALGVFGEAGAGLCAQAGVRPDLLVGTLGKAVGVQGAFVAASGELRSLLWNRARSFVFSTGVSPLLAALTRVRVAQVRADEAARRTLTGLCRRLADFLQPLSVPAGRHGPIFPVVLGDVARALAAASELGRRGIITVPIRPPTVPEGAARLRLTVRASMTPAEVDRLGQEVRAVCAGS